MNTVHMLHIPKTAGSALQFILGSKLNNIDPERTRLELCGHAKTLAQIFEGEEGKQPLVAFFVRDPVSRFRSGFNSRLRQGQPRYNSPWTAKEQMAFGVYRTPDQLASALSAEDSAQKSARCAFNVIRHVRRQLSRWLISPEYLDQHVDRIFYIGLQETFESDAKGLLRKLGLDDTLPEMDEHVRHATPQGFDLTLSDRAIENLKRWYADDYEIYDWCVKMRTSVNARQLDI
jgi:hypothetical protein